MNRAFVEIVYSNDAASFGGFATGLTMHAEIYEVEAKNEGDARKKATDKFKEWNNCGMCTLRRCEFKRWV